MKLPLEHGVGVSLVVESELPNVIALVEFQTKIACVLFACEVVGNSSTGGVWSRLLIEIESAVVSTKFVVFVLEFNERSILHCFVEMTSQSQLKFIVFINSIANHFLAHLEMWARGPRILRFKHWNLSCSNHLLCLKLIIGPSNTQFWSVPLLRIDCSIVMDDDIFKSLS